jgi:hypothetical protein
MRYVPSPLRIHHAAGLYWIHRPNREQPPSRRERGNYPTLLTGKRHPPVSTASTCSVRTSNGSEEHKAHYGRNTITSS